MKKCLILFLSLLTGQIFAQRVEIDTISYGRYGGKVAYTDTYYFTKKSIIKRRVYSDAERRTEKTLVTNSTESWNRLLSQISIASFSKIKSGESTAAHCGSDTYIELTLKNGKKIGIINGNDKMWDKIQEELFRLKELVDKK